MTLPVGVAQLAEVYLDTPSTVDKDIKYIRRVDEIGLDLLYFRVAPRRDASLVQV